MAWRKARIAIASTLLAGLAGTAAAGPAPVGSLCNAEGKIQVFAHQASIGCTDSADSELKALLKARGEYKDMSGLSLEEKAQVDARIQRRLREIWKIKSAAKSAPAAGQNAAAAAQ